MSRRTIGGVVLAAALAAAAWVDVAAQSASQEEAQMMEKMAQAAAPGAHHKHLAQLAGSWNAKGKMWMAPDQPPIESTGVMKNRMILGGRFLESDYEGEGFGAPMTGLGIEGYDNTLEKHVGTWIDSLGTMMLSYQGECSQGGKVLTTHTEFEDPTTGVMTKMKMVTTQESPGKYVFEGYMQVPGSAEVKTMEIVYTRQ